MVIDDKTHKPPKSIENILLTKAQHKEKTIQDKRKSTTKKELKII